jgi:hypothetical protein
MKVGCRAIEHQTAVRWDRASKPAEEQEEVTDADTAVLEVRLGSTNLPKERPPARRSRAGFFLEVRIQVRTVIGLDSSVRERGYES